jgi:hypothetical protein
LCNKADCEQQHEFGGHPNFLSRYSATLPLKKPARHALAVGGTLYPSRSIRSHNESPVTAARRLA